MTTNWQADDTVVLLFCLLGFGGGVAAPKMGCSPIVEALLLATGVAVPIYRFLGGIGDSSFTMGALKLTGTAAFLVGMTWFVDSKLVEELSKAQASTIAFTTAGLANRTFRWDYGTGGMTDDFRFSLDQQNNVVFSGLERLCVSDEKPNKNEVKCNKKYEVTNGRAKIIDGGFVLQAQVHDVTCNHDFEWQTVQPLKQTVAFEGSLQDPKDPSQR
jgi:hypothetical protein